MSNETTSAFLSAFVELFDEAYSGPSDSKYTFFTDNAPNSAILGTLDTLSAEQASRLQSSEQSIASHAEHLRWSLELAQAYFRGEQPKADWEESWRVTSVTDEEWKALRDNLRREYKEVRDAIGAVTDWSNPFFLKGTLALLPHAAYHLGAIRQMVKSI
ncbi:hypothetical protein EON83_16825 [bacterium]|nr:MAG: hypothetical protein EON83_16825 [bacterium]